MLMEYFTLFAKTSPINRRAVNVVVTGALQRAVFSIGATFTWIFTMNPLENQAASLSFDQSAIVFPWNY